VSGVYEVHVTHKGLPDAQPQVFSLLISGQVAPADADRNDSAQTKALDAPAEAR
jgi:hypothetical protein